MRNFFLTMMILLSLGYAKSNLQETIEYDYPMRVMVYRMIDKDFREHTTIIYAKSTFNRRPNATSTFAQYDSTVNEGLISKVYANCKDTIITVHESEMYLDSTLEISFDYKIRGVYYPTGSRNWSSKELLLAIPCGFKSRNRR